MITIITIYCYYDEDMTASFIKAVGNSSSYFKFEKLQQMISHCTSSFN